MIPLPTPNLRLHNRTIHKSHPTKSKQDTPQRFPVAEIASCVDGQADKYVSGAVQYDEAVDEFSIGGGCWRGKFEDGEGVGGAEHAVDAEACGEGAEEEGEEEEGARVGEGCCGRGRGHVWEGGGLVGMGRG